jgi:hypothetical protein
VLRVWGWQVPVALYVEPQGSMGAEEPSLPLRPTEVSRSTYDEIRQLLVRDGVAGTFDHYEGREMIELEAGRLRIVARREHA